MPTPGMSEANPEMVAGNAEEFTTEAQRHREEKTHTEKPENHEGKRKNETGIALVADKLGCRVRRLNFGTVHFIGINRSSTTIPLCRR